LNPHDPVLRYMCTYLNLDKLKDRQYNDKINKTKIINDVM